MKRMLPSLLAAFVFLAGIAAPAVAAQSPAAQSPLPRDSIYQLPVQLTDQDGRTQPWSALRGKPRLMAMFYTSCQYICPLIVDSGKAIEKQLDERERGRIGIVLISMDPERDDPAALKKVVEQRKLDTSRWTLASPPTGEVRAVAGVLDTRYRALADGEFNHTSSLVLVDADGRILARTDQMGSKPDPEFVAKVKQALRQPL